MPFPILPRRWDAYLTCIVVSLLGHASLNWALGPMRSEPLFILYILAGRICISCVWIRLYQLLTGEAGLDPLVNFAITFLAPYVADVY